MGTETLGVDQMTGGDDGAECADEPNEILGCPKAPPPTPRAVLSSRLAGGGGGLGARGVCVFYFFEGGMQTREGGRGKLARRATLRPHRTASRLSKGRADPPALDPRAELWRRPRRRRGCGPGAARRAWGGHERMLIQDQANDVLPVAQPVICVKR